MNRLITLLAASVSFGALAMLIFWGVSLSQMDPSEIPVLKRQAGPARVQPDNPGGEEIDHQGLAVNTVQAIGETAKPVDRVILAPSTDQLAPEDGVGIAPQSTVEEIATATLPETVQISAQGELPASLQQLAVGSATPTAAVEVTQSAETVAAPTAENQAEIGSGEILSPQNAIARPKHRPNTIPATPSAVAATPAPVEAAPEVAEPSLKSGTPVVQFGAYASRTIAEAEWVKAQAKLDDLLGEKQPIYQIAKVSGKTYHRLRVAGVANFEDAKSFCVAVKAKGRDCLPSKIR